MTNGILKAFFTLPVVVQSWYFPAELWLNKACPIKRKVIVLIELTVKVFIVNISKITAG